MDRGVGSKLSDESLMQVRMTELGQGNHVRSAKNAICVGGDGRSVAGSLSRQAGKVSDFVELFLGIEDVIVKIVKS